MTTSQVESSDQSPTKVTIPSNLALPDAAALRESVLATLDGADGTLELDLDGEDPSICALQFLISVRRSADLRSLTLSQSANVSAAFDNIDMK